MTLAVDKSKARHKRFDASRVPSTPQALALVEQVRKELLNYEAKCHPRRRARKVVDQVRFDRIVSAIVCDLMHGALTDPVAWRHISLSKRSHGKDSVGVPFMTEERIKIIEWMSKPEMDWLELSKAAQVRNPFGGQQSTIRSSGRLRRHMDERGIRFADIGRDGALMGDPIVLRGKKVRGKASSLPVPSGEPADTYRAEMLRINAWLAAADIECDCDDKGNERDSGDRWVSRIFNNGRLEEGGRPTGGFWAQLSGKSRQRDVRINGEPVVSLDYGQCGIRIAYGLLGVEPPAGDLYCVPGLESYREGVKKVFIAQFFSPRELARKPQGSAKHLPRHSTVREVEELILRHHRPLRSMFYSGAGMEIQSKEGHILIRCLLELIERRIVALPVYDCLVVPRSAIEETRQVMLDCFRQIAGVSGHVEIKEGVGK
ncbi:hypothetical protein ACXU4B_11865 [Dyella soli]|uniref:Uncharacterized protein n=1 Tax=Dyella soli TaxID=522319 RepID=A0A4V2NL27_9GAMM|nr:hypothetical protein [Dyella soli]TCI07148.1 hypothetical protein EZM97_31575 [Dyella soli]